MVVIRNEAPEDYEEVRRVNQLAFGQDGEARLVDALREAAPHISLVAVVDGQIVGHIFFSPVEVEGVSSSFEAMGLAPMAVVPEYQNKGIGSELVCHGLKACTGLGHEIVFVLGHPRYYPRFGFSTASAKGLRSEYDVPDEVFMVVELRPGALRGRTGTVKYRPEFASV